jgi:hypothetical protein
LAATTEESNAATHAAARDSWAGVRPSEDQIEVTADEQAAIVRAVMGEDACVDMVYVARQS